VKKVREDMPTWASIAKMTASLYQELTGIEGNRRIPPLHTSGESIDGEVRA